jgi:uncharacterized membrane protein YoaK (UPF0700 family)
MTVVTGLVDAFSYLVLGHVFVANMTGNVVFLGFAIAGAQGFSIAASLVALVSFGFGSLLGGRIVTKYGSHRGRHLATAMAAESVFLAVSVVLALWSSSAPQHGLRYALIVVLSLATGIQNANIRKLAVPDLTTTVLTMTVTGIGADSLLAGGKGSKSGRRILAVAAMFLGALLGALLVLHVRIVVPLVIALVVAVFVAVTSYEVSKADPPWTLVENE